MEFVLVVLGIILLIVFLLKRTSFHKKVEEERREKSASPEKTKSVSPPSSSASNIRPGKDLVCPACEKPIDGSDVSWKCPQCGYYNQHISVVTTCEKCNFGPKYFKCPHCGQEYGIELLFGNYGEKPSSGKLGVPLKAIEPFSAPHISVDEAMAFLSHFGSEILHLSMWPKSMFIHTLEYALPRHSFAEGYMLSISVDDAMDLLAKLDAESMKKHIVGSLRFEMGGSLSEPKVIVEESGKKTSS